MNRARTGLHGPGPDARRPPGRASDQEEVETLRHLLIEAKALGFLGPPPVEAHLDQARAFAEAVEAATRSCSTRRGAGEPLPMAVVDLGSGAGVPGLALALRWVTSSFLFVDSRQRRAAFLVRAVRALGLTGRAVVAAERAETLGRTEARRAAFDVVTARGFGRPAIVAECAAPLLGPGGLLVVSEPPVDDDFPGADQRARSGRWSSQGLAELGMGAAQPAGADYRFVLVRQERRCPPRFPRRAGIPSKRPVF